ncbi:hypothetical protein BGZ99_004846 [Dissophora globulifera]|uniref:Uncharacterized protein n=1 Tax=Dissophora globulifera TaxID=979702 RepID=A0A9P6RGR5_9FUNG|nr:hypothetical protein BGZ99_004846 [Dissophora globulifera]
MNPAISVRFTVNLIQEDDAAAEEETSCNDITGNDTVIVIAAYTKVRSHSVSLRIPKRYRDTTLTMLDVLKGLFKGYAEEPVLKRPKLELERDNLELERDNLELERDKLELDTKNAETSLYKSESQSLFQEMQLI